MKFSRAWLNELLGWEISVAQLTEQLTMAGLEVAAVEPVAPEFRQVVVGMVRATRPHPNADQLTLCDVEVGQAELLEIVCGAKNVRSGLKVAVALVGAELPGAITIKPAKLRGIVSQGMLCSTAELGLVGDHAAGILELPAEAPVGVDLRDYWQLNDQVIELELTPNRGDCLSMWGLAREVAGLNRRTWEPQDVTQGHSPQSNSVSNVSESLAVGVEDEQGAPHYAGRVIRGIDNQIETPAWMKMRLQRAGLNTVNLVVDITNYVMLELGQPLHAFDLSKIVKSIVVRRARPSEKILLLNGQEVVLDSDVMVIADAQQPLAIAGVMGGANSGVERTSCEIFLESAYFAPEQIAKQVQGYHLNSDASFRFERGVDFQLQLSALERATDLIIALAGGRVTVSKVTEFKSTQNLPTLPTIELRYARLQEVLGVAIERPVVSETLCSLGGQLEEWSEGWRLVPPSYRFDLRIEEDLIEEVARLYGYGQVTEQPIEVKLTATSPIQGSHRERLDRLEALLEDRGYFEVVTYSFVDQQFQQLFDNEAAALSLINPITSDLNVMRNSLWPGLVKVLQYNLQRQQSRVKIFEIGLKFIPGADGQVEQRPILAGLGYGEIYPEQWGVAPSRFLDFFDLKDDVAAALSLFIEPLQIEWEAAVHPALHPKRTARIRVRSTRSAVQAEPVVSEQAGAIGYLGALHPALAQRFGIGKSCYLFELDLAFISNKLQRQYQPISKFPKIVRDLSLVADQSLAWEAIQQEIMQNSDGLLGQAVLFDRYLGSEIGKHQQSLAVRLTFQSRERTLIDNEVEAQIQQIIERLERNLGVILRGGGDDVD